MVDFLLYMHIIVSNVRRMTILKYGFSVLHFVLLSERFVGIVLLVFFSKFGDVARNPYEVHDAAVYSGKKFFTSKIGKMFCFFLKLLTNLAINFYSICSVMKIYIIYCVPAQIPYLEKSFCLRYESKYYQLIRF